jgi:acyl carrier protein
MTIREEAIEVLVQKSAGLFGKDPSALGADTRFIEDLQAKSVNFVQLSAALEDKFEVEVPYMEFRKKSTFGEAADYIVKMLGE